MRNYLQYGGHGLLVFDMDNHFKFVKRIATGGLDDSIDGKYALPSTGDQFGIGRK